MLCNIYIRRVTALCIQRVELTMNFWVTPPPMFGTVAYKDAEQPCDTQTALWAVSTSPSCQEFDIKSQVYVRIQTITQSSSQLSLRMDFLQHFSDKFTMGHHKTLWEVKVKLSLCFNWVPRHEGVVGEWKYIHTYMTSTLDGGGWSASPRRPL
jgi:hypothetical protein